MPMQPTNVNEPTARQSITTDLERRIAIAAFPEGFKILDLESISSWVGPLSANVRARLLMSHIATEPTPDVVEDLAQAIASIDDWDDVLAGFLRNAPISPDIILAAARVAQLRSIDIPWAGITRTPRFAAAVYDGLDDGEIIRFSPLHHSS